jgi:hypothetical protein
MNNKRIALKDLVVVKENQDKPMGGEDQIKEISLNLREADDDSLTRIINMRISDTQLKKLKTKADDDKTTVSDFIRGKLFK